MRKFILTIVSLFLFASCTYFEVNEAVNMANRGDYVPALARLSQIIQKGNKSALENFQIIYPQAEQKYIQQIKDNKNTNLVRYARGLRNLLTIQEIYLGLSAANQNSMNLLPVSLNDRYTLKTEAAKAFQKLGNVHSRYSYPEKLRRYGLFKEAEAFNVDRKSDITSNYNEARKEAEGRFFINIVDNTYNDVASDLYSGLAFELNQYPLFQPATATNYNLEFDINLSNFQYVPSDVRTKSSTGSFDDIVTKQVNKVIQQEVTQNGKVYLVEKVVPTYQNVKVRYKYRCIEYIKTSYISFDLRYIIREKNGNILYSNTRNIKINDVVSWKEYFPLDYFVGPLPNNFPETESEKFNVGKPTLINKAKTEIRKELYDVIKKLSSNQEINI